MRLADRYGGARGGGEAGVGCRYDDHVNWYTTNTYKTEEVVRYGRGGV